jgi:hypothetical protein
MFFMMLAPPAQGRTWTFLRQQLEAILALIDEVGTDASAEESLHPQSHPVRLYGAPQVISASICQFVSKIVYHRPVA